MKGENANWNSILQKAATASRYRTPCTRHDEDSEAAVTTSQNLMKRNGPMTLCMGIKAHAYHVYHCCLCAASQSQPPFIILIYSSIC